MKRLRSISTAALFILFFSCTAAFASLPELPNYENGALRVTKLDALSGNQGTWEERDYKTASGEKIHAVWIEGTPEKSWTPVKANNTKSALRLESESSYKNAEILGYAAVLEDQPFVGKSLAVKVTRYGTLTLESKNADEKTLVQTARALVFKITE
jgi:hypothetical protein